MKRFINTSKFYLYLAVFGILLALAITQPNLFLNKPFEIEKAYAAEQRCGELGANCVCSEPFNTTTFTQIGNAWWNPADSTTKECRIEGQAGGAFTRVESSLAGDLFGTNDVTIMGALPAGHNNTYVLRGAEDHTGLWNVGSQFNSSDPTARRSFRMYVYYSPNFMFTADNSSCQNSGKLVQFANEGPIMTYNGNWLVYGWSSPWNIAGYDSSYIGPGGDVASIGLPSSYWKGKWWRVEVVTRNVGGTPTIFQVYMKNVTDNQPELKVIDTSIPTTQPVGADWTSVQATTLTRPAWGDMFFDLFRRDPGFCPGYFAVSHMVFAAWPTDAGQRIGAATEIEGGGGPTPTPGGPSLTPTPTAGPTPTPAPTIAPSASWSHVQTTANSSAAATNVLSFPQSTGAGDTLIAQVDWSNTVNFSSITDSQGNVFTQIGTEQNNTSFGNKSRLYYAKNIIGGADTITTTLSGIPGGHELYIHEYSGLDQVSPLDTFSVKLGSGTSFTSNPVTTASGNELLYGMEVDSGSATADSGWTVRSNFHNNVAADQNAATAVSYTFSGTSSGSQTIWLAAFRPAGGATSTPTPCSIYNSLTPLSQIPLGFGVPWDILSPGNELLLNVNNCNTGTAGITVGKGDPNQYIWPDVYVSKAGTAWQKTALTGTSSPSSPWLLSTGTTTISGVNASSINYLAAYVCTYTGTEWKCGCSDNVCTGATANRWQIQRFGL